MTQVDQSSEFVDRLANDLALSNPHIEPWLFRNFILACKVWPYEWGAIMAHGNDMHIHIFSTWQKRVFLRKPLREVAFFMFESYAEIKTSILKSKPDALDFDLRMGWKLVGEEPDRWHLKMKKEDFRYGCIL